MTTKENEIISSRSDEHNHPPNEAEIVASMAVEKMKQQVQEKIDPVPAIYQQQLRELSSREDLDQVAANLPTLPSLKSSPYRLRRKRLPPIPTTREEVHFCGEWLKTDAGENFLLVEDGQGDNKIMIIFHSVLFGAPSTSREDVCQWGLSDLPRVRFSLCMHSKMADSSP